MNSNDGTAAWTTVPDFSRWCRFDTTVEALAPGLESVPGHGFKSANPQVTR